MLKNVHSIVGITKLTYKVLPSVVALYEDVFQDENPGQIDKPENVAKIIEFVMEKFDIMSDHVAPNELVMIVCGIVGCLHPGDSSNLYLSVLSKMENEG